MAFLRKLFQGGSKSKKKDYPNVVRGNDPLEQWRKVGEIGDGAFGKVYKAEHVESGKLAALKRVPIQEESELDDFMVEIDILAECKHPNIVQLYEAFFYDSALWIFIEFCSGGAVDDIIVELDHGLSEPQIKCIAKQMLSGLQFLHDNNCIHRDLKAGNILLLPDGTIRLADFGVSAKDSKGKRRHDTFIGTPYWMAPEVVICETIKDNPYDEKADIWSVGVTMIELADMNPPFHEMSPMRVLLKITKSEPPTLLAPTRWSKEFNNFLSKCLVKDPSGRLSAGDLLSHPFIANVSDYKPLRTLYQEMKSEVEEIVEELPEDADLTQDPEHYEETLSETPSLAEASTLSPLPAGGTPPTPQPTETGPILPQLSEDTPVSPLPSEDIPLTPQPSGEAPLSPLSSGDLQFSITPGSETSSELGPEAEVLSLTESELGPEAVALSPTESEEVAPKEVDVSPERSPEPPEVGPEPVPVGTTEPELSVEAETVQVLKPKASLPSEEGSLSSEISTPSGELSAKESSEDLKKNEYKYATLSRVRKFKVDGKTVQSTTKKIVDVKGNKTLRDNKKYQEMRKQDFRELKQLQREEIKEANEFYSRIRLDREVLEKKFEAESLDLKHRLDADTEQMTKRQKKAIDKLEKDHIQRFRTRSKIIKSQQSKDQKRFKENRKEEEKLAIKRVEVSTTSKAERKQAMTMAKAEIQMKRLQKEREFEAQMAKETESELKRILDEQKDERKNLELSFLDARQDLKRSHTSSEWEMEQRQKQEKHQLLKQQLREAFHMQRHQMHVRHTKEVELQGRRDQFRLEELRQRHLLEKRQLPKSLKTDHKAQVAALRKAIRNKKTDNEKEKFRQLDEQYVRKSQVQTELMNDRHEKELETLRAELDANMRELQEIQNEKKMQLTQQETNKVKERDDQHTQDLRDWRGELGKRKQKLEDEFRIRREEEEKFYSAERPLPKELRKTFSLPNASVTRAERTDKTRSVTSFSGSPMKASSQNSSSLQALDEIVLGQPPLVEMDNEEHSDSVPNGSSS